MAVKVKPLAEITQDALSVLCKEIGIVNTVRFVNQFTIGYGNYTQEREQLFSGMTVDELIAEVKKRAAQD
jgi:hypothetical protein